MVQNRRQRRILIAGSPPIFPEIDIPELVAEMGGIVVLDVSSTGGECPNNASGTENRCPVCREPMAVFTNSAAGNDRAALIIRMTELFFADAVLFYVLKGWAIDDMVLHRVENVMKEKHIPLLRVEADYGLDSVGLQKARVGAFIHQLHSAF